MVVQRGDHHFRQSWSSPKGQGNFLKYALVRSKTIAARDGNVESERPCLTTSYVYTYMYIYIYIYINISSPNMTPDRRFFKRKLIFHVPSHKCYVLKNDNLIRVYALYVYIYIYIYSQGQPVSRTATAHCRRLRLDFLGFGAQSRQSVLRAGKDTPQTDFTFLHIPVHVLKCPKLFAAHSRHWAILYIRILYAYYTISYYHKVCACAVTVMVPAEATARVRLWLNSQIPWIHIRCRVHFKEFHKGLTSVAFCSPAKCLIFSGLIENPLVGKKLKS